MRWNPFSKPAESRSMPFGQSGGSWGDGGPAPWNSANPENAMRMVPVWGAVRFLASNIAAMAPGLGLYKLSKDGDIAVRQPTPALFANPSIHGTLFQWFERAVFSMGLQGDGIGLITQRDSTNLPTMIEWLNPINVITMDQAIEGPGSYVDPRWYWWGRPMDPKDLLHIPLFARPWRVRGLAPISAYATSVGINLAAMEYSKRWYDEGGVPPGTFQNKTQKVLPDDAEQIADNMARRLRGRKPFVYGMDWEFNPIAIKPHEALFLETMQATATQIAVIYGVPADKIGGLTGGSLTYACADGETEILTLRGWLRYDELTTDDTCLTLNTETGMSEWQQVQAVNVYEGCHPVIKMENAGHSSVTTPNHRWPVTFTSPTRTDRFGVDEGLGAESRYSRRFAGYNWRTTETLSSDARICAAAPVVTPTAPKWSDALVELIAWLWTEGWVGQHGSVTLTQSQGVNPNQCARIRAALTEIFGPSGPLHMRSRPSWREDIDARAMIHFRLNAKAGAVLLPHAPDKVVTVEFLSQLTRAQLELFIETSIDADGYRRGALSARTPGVRMATIAQRDKRRIDAFQIACTLAGRSGSVRQNAAGMWTMCVRTTSWRKPTGHTKSETVLADGVVWCPTTPNSTWFARRNGTVYATGNTVEQNSLDCLTYTFRPWLVRFEYAFSTCFPRGYFVQFNTDEFLRVDAKTRAEIDALSLGTVQTGWKDPNEVRASYNMPPRKDPPPEPASAGPAAASGAPGRNGNGPAAPAPSATSAAAIHPGSAQTPGTSAAAAEPISRSLRDRWTTSNGHPVNGINGNGHHEPAPAR